MANLEAPLEFELNFNLLEEIESQFGTTTTSLEAEIRTSMLHIFQDLALDIGDNKLSGQLVNARSGDLREGVIDSAEVYGDGDLITGVLGIPQSVWYGMLFEFGGQYTVQSRSNVYGRGGIARSYTVSFPETSFIRSELEERSDSIFESLQEAVARGLKGGS